MRNAGFWVKLSYIIIIIIKVFMFMTVLVFAREY